MSHNVIATIAGMPEFVLIPAENKCYTFFTIATYHYDIPALTNVLISCSTAYDLLKNYRKGDEISITISSTNIAGITNQGSIEILHSGEHVHYCERFKENGVVKYLMHDKPLMKYLQN